MLDLGEADTESDINTALGLLKAAVDQAETACDKFEDSSASIFGDSDTYTASTSQINEVKDALDNVKTMFDTDLTDDETKALIGVGVQIENNNVVIPV